MITRDYDILRANPEQAEAITELVFEAKRLWDYPEHYFDLWRDSLTVTKDYIEKNVAYILKSGNEIIAMYSIVEDEDVMELDHLWVKPKVIGRGIGSIMFKHAAEWLSSHGYKEVHVIADPNAVGFYQRFGAVKIGDFESTPKGRMLSVLSIPIE